LVDVRALPLEGAGVQLQQMVLQCSPLDVGEDRRQLTPDALQQLDVGLADVGVLGELETQRETPRGLQFDRYGEYHWLDVLAQLLEAARIAVVVAGQARGPREARLPCQAVRVRGPSLMGGCCGASAVLGHGRHAAAAVDEDRGSRGAYGWGDDVECLAGRLRDGVAADQAEAQRRRDRRLAAAGALRKVPADAAGEDLEGVPLRR